MTESEYKAIDTALKEAEKSDTPFLIATEDELVVAGDANKTELNIHDFEITFRVPVEEGGVTKQITKTKEYKNVYITPRKQTRVLKAFTALEPFFRNITEAGDLTEMDHVTIGKLIVNMEDDMFDVMYDLVSVVLGIDPELSDYMMPDSVLESAIKIICMYPEAANEADVFFGRSSAMR